MGVGAAPSPPAHPRLRRDLSREGRGQKTPALRAGIDFSRGDVLVTMDGDLQNDPADIPLLLDKLAEGYDAVFGLRARRQDHLLIRKLPSMLGNWLIRKLAQLKASLESDQDVETLVDSARADIETRRADVRLPPESRRSLT